MENHIATGSATSVLFTSVIEPMVVVCDGVHKL